MSFMKIGLKPPLRTMTDAEWQDWLQEVHRALSFNHNFWEEEIVKTYDLKEATKYRERADALEYIIDRIEVLLPPEEE